MMVKEHTSAETIPRGGWPIFEPIGFDHPARRRPFVGEELDGPLFRGQGSLPLTGSLTACGCPSAQRANFPQSVKALLGINEWFMRNDRI
jgi:hypothetical protein